MKTERLFYNNPANKFIEALPIGNGRIGAMVYGGIANEVYSLNEDTLWSGTPRNNDDKEVWQYFDNAKNQALKGNLKEAQEIIEKNLCGEYNEAYMPLGRLVIEQKFEKQDVKNYIRELDIAEAVHKVSFEIGSCHYKRESFISTLRQTMYVKYTSSESMALNLKLSLDSQLKFKSEAMIDEVKMLVQCPTHAEPRYIKCENPITYSDEKSLRGLSAVATVKVLSCDGKLKADNESIIISDASCVVLAFCTRSNFESWNVKPCDSTVPYKENCLNDLKLANQVTYDEAKKEHIEDYKQYFSRVELHLDGEEEFENLPTDERLKQFQKTNYDQGLPVLLFDYARYLMISASRQGSQAMNLQGIWNDSLVPPWSSNYTVNINTEMNYWPSLPCNLVEMQEPLVHLMEELKQAGKKVAEKYYHADGFVVHHNVDLWRNCNPVGRHSKGCAIYGFWPMASGWLCRHLYEQYEYTLDKEFLKNSVYPVLHDAAEFYLDVLSTDENGYRIFAPSTSPENCFMLDGEPLAVAKTTTMTVSILKELFSNCVKCCDTLNIDQEFKQKLKDEISKMPPLKIGTDGRLLEWDQEYEEETPENRHVSHLYGLFPADEISPRTTKDLADAAKKSLIARTDEGTGWSLGWKINFWAKLLDGDRALKLLKRQLRLTEGEDVVCEGGGTYPNLFDAHPPFQIDGNFGTCSGIAQMLLQEENDELLILPALPKEWKSGSVTGLLAKGGLTVDIHWENCLPDKVVIKSICKQTLKVIFGDKVKELTLNENVPAILAFTEY